MLSCGMASCGKAVMVRNGSFSQGKFWLREVCFGMAVEVGLGGVR
jgi:hypothetical protein